MAIPNIFQIEAGTTAATYNYPTDAGFRYTGGKITFAFSTAAADFNKVTAIKIQASFDDANWIDLTDSVNSPVSVSGNSILTVDIGKCKLRFNTVIGATTTGVTNITVS
jgi:hypothetical protein